MSKELLENLKILIVEDEEKISKLLKEALGDYFKTVVVAKDGIEGISKYKSTKPDVVITDIMMPNCDGLEMTTRLKLLNENLPIIVLSAFSDKDKLLKAIDVGIDKYFIKPFDPEELIAYLSNLSIKINKKKKTNLKENFIFDNRTNSLYKDNKLVNLTKREKEFVYVLIQNQNEVLDINFIKEHLWDEVVSDERLRTFIKRLRIKTSKTFIENASGQGYLISKNDI